MCKPLLMMMYLHRQRMLAMQVVSSHMMIIDIQKMAVPYHRIRRMCVAAVVVLVFAQLAYPRLMRCYVLEEVLAIEFRNLSIRIQYCVAESGRVPFPHC